MTWSGDLDTDDDGNGIADKIHVIPHSSPLLASEASPTRSRMAVDRLMSRLGSAERRRDDRNDVIVEETDWLDDSLITVLSRR